VEILVSRLVPKDERLARLQRKTGGYLKKQQMFCSKKIVIEFRLKVFLELVQCTAVSIVGTLPCSLIEKV